VLTLIRRFKYNRIDRPFFGFWGLFYRWLEYKPIALVEIAINGKDSGLKKAAIEKLQEKIFFGESSGREAQRAVDKLRKYCLKNNYESRIAEDLLIRLLTLYSKLEKCDKYSFLILEKIILLNNEWSRNVIEEIFSKKGLYREKRAIKEIIFELGESSIYSVEFTSDQFEELGEESLMRMCERTSNKEIEDFLIKKLPKLKLPGRFVAYMVEKRDYRIVDFILKERIDQDGTNVPAELFHDYTELVNRILKIGREVNESSSRGELRRTETKYDISDSTAAVRELCKIDSDVSSNLLNLVSKRSDREMVSLFIEVTDDYYDSKRTRISFQAQRTMAKSELGRRNNPDYDPEYFCEEGMFFKANQ
jgi:hypothetical protein